VAVIVVPRRVLGVPDPSAPGDGQVGEPVIEPESVGLLIVGAVSVNVPPNVYVPDDVPEKIGEL
jgi:hypothetical protein